MRAVEIQNVMRTFGLPLNELVPQKPFRSDIPAPNIEASERAARAGIGYAPKAHDERSRQVPTGELTDYIEIVEAKLPKEFHLSKVVIFPKKMA